MSELDPKETPERETEEGQPPSYVPASIYKRIYAWIGVVYMVIIVALVTFFISTGRTVTGITGIMLAPGLIGFGIAKGVQGYKAEFTADRVGPVIWCVLCEVLGVASLIWGIFQLIAFLKG